MHRILETDGFEGFFHRILGYAVGDESIESGYKGSEGRGLCSGREEERFDIVCGVVVFLVAVIDVSGGVADDIWMLE